MTSYQLKSMTAYGRGISFFSYGQFIVEIQSVNRRFLEINVNMPRILMRFEIDLRKMIAAKVGRGMINVSISWKAEGHQPISVTPNLNLAHALKTAWERIASELEMEKSIPLSLLAQEKELLRYEEEIVDENAYRKALHEALTEALNGLLTMKVEEGSVLKKEVSGRLEKLQAGIELIKTRVGEGCEKYRKKLQNRLDELLKGNVENEERILREVAVYADRVDFTEEIVRFNSHLEQFEQQLQKPHENEVDTRGKTFDFLLQELLREINTLGSKGDDLLISQQVVAIKSELEKIKEQVQNIE